MRRPALLVLAWMVFAACAVAGHAQQLSNRVYRLGMLETTPAAENKANIEALVAGLRDLGYVEGRNFVIDYTSADGRDERFPDLAAQLVKRRPDVIVTRGTPAALAAKHATSTIPVVMAAIGDALRVVDSLARPGGNVTGLSALVRELQPKRVELLTELDPGITRIALLANPDNEASAGDWNELLAAARSRGLAAQRLLVRKPEEIEPAIAAAQKQGVDALIVQEEALTQTNAGLITALAAKDRLLAIYQSKRFVHAGGLISYGVDYPALYRQAAVYVGKILSGAKPADLPVEQPTVFTLAVNLEAAKALAVKVPKSIILSANEVVE